MKIWINKNLNKKYNSSNYRYEGKRLINKNSKKIIKRKIKNKKKFFSSLKYIIIFLVVLILLFLILFILKLPKEIFNKQTIDNLNESLIYKDPEQENKNIQEYLNMIKNGTLYDKGRIYYPTDNPKISIVLPVWNGEGFLNETLLSIQNQDFKDIEIIIVDDHSTDNSVDLIKYLMKTEPRISFYQNEENKGALYTKSRGVLLSKGKYIMIIDDDDKYLQREAFTTLYTEAEKYDLDIVKFRMRQSTTIIKINPNSTKKLEPIDSPIIYQPELSDFMYFYNNSQHIRRNGGTLYNQMFRADLFKKVIKEIDDKYLNSLMKDHEDFLLFFLLTRMARNLKQINGVFYLIVVTRAIHGKSKVDYRRKEKAKDRYNLRCRAFLNYVEIVFNKTKDTIKEKKIPFYELEMYYLNHDCRNNMEVREKGKRVCKLLLNSNYIEEKNKNKIRKFLDKIELTNSTFFL